MRNSEQAGYKTQRQMPKIITSKTPDSELFERMADLQKVALSELYDRYADRLYGLAYKILGNAGVAEDVLQELFIYLWKNAAKFKIKGGSVSTPLMILCRDRSIDKLRSRASIQDYTSTTDGAVLLNFADSKSNNSHDNISYIETQKRVKSALQELPPEQIESIMLAYFEGLAQSEIAERTNQSLGTIKTRVRLGMEKLKTILNPEYQP